MCGTRFNTEVDYMLEVKTVSRGNSLALSLPSNSGFKCEKDQRWLMIPSADGTSFTLVPRIEDPYARPAAGEPMAEEWADADFNEVE